MLGAPSRWRQNETALGSPSSAKIKDRQLRALRRCYSRAHQFPAVAPVLIAWVDRELLDNGGLVVAAQHINAGNELGTEEPAELDELHVAVSGVIHEHGIDRYGELSPFVGEGRDGSDLEQQVLSRGRQMLSDPHIFLPGPPALDVRPGRWA